MTSRELTGVFTYTPHEKALAKAAADRYGVTTAWRILGTSWPRVPVLRTVINWRRDEHIVVTEEHRDYWRQYDAEMATRARARVLPTFERAISVLDHQLAHPDDMERMSKVQGLAITTGILFDKLVPSARGGAGISFDGVGTVNLMVMAPSEEAAGRVARVIDIESP